MSIGTLLTSNGQGFRAERVGGFSTPEANSSGDDFYTAFASEFVGDWFLLKGGGANHDLAPVTFSPVGSPASEDLAMVSGPNGALVGTQDTPTTSDYFTTGAVASPAGSFSVLYMGRFGAASTSILMAKDAPGGTGRSFNIYASGSGLNVSTELYRTDAASTAAGASNVVTPLALAVIAYTYQFVADGTSVVRIYMNGVQGATTSTAVGPVQANTTAWQVHHRGFGDGTAGNFRLAAMSETVWSPATVAAMSTFLLDGVAQTGRGAAVSLTRATPATLTLQGQVVTVGSGRHRITGGGLLVEAAATNNLLQSRAFGTTWVPTNVTVSSPASGGRDLSTIANRLTATAANGTLLQALTLAAATRTFSIDVKRVTGTGAIQITRDNGGTWTTLDATNCFNDSLVGTAPHSGGWVRARLTSSVLNPTVGLQLVTSGDAIDVDWAQDEVGAIPTARVLTTGAAATRNADVYTIPTTGWPTTAGNVSLEYTHHYDGNPPADIMLFDGGGAVSTSGVSVRITTTGAIRVDTRNTSTNTATTAGAQTWTQGQTYALRIRWVGGSVFIYRDEVLLLVGGAKAMPDGWLANAFLGSLSGTTAFLNGYITNLRVYRDI